MPSVTTKVIDIPKFNALDRAAADRQRKVLEGFVGKDSEAKASPSQVQAAIQAGREIVRSGKIPPPDPNAPPNPRQLQSRRDQPAGRDQGRHDGAAARRAPGLHRSGRGAARRRRQDRPAERRRRHHAAAHRDHQRPVRHRHDADQARRQPEHRRQEQRRVAAVGRRQHAVAAAHALPAAAGNGAAEAHLPRRDAGAARQGRRPESPHRARIPGTWSTPAAATATAASPTPPARPRSGAPPTAST